MTVKSPKALLSPLSKAKAASARGASYLSHKTKRFDFKNTNAKEGESAANLDSTVNAMDKVGTMDVTEKKQEVAEPTTIAAATDSVVPDEVDVDKTKVLINSVTGYDTVLEDIRYSTELENNKAKSDKLKNEIEKNLAPPPVKEINLEVTEVEERPQEEVTLVGSIKNFFSGGSGVSSKDPKEEGVPELKKVSSSSSGGSGNSAKSTKENFTDWAERISQCHIDMPCGKLEFDLTKEDSAPADTTPKESNALVEVVEDEVSPAPEAAIPETASPESVPDTESWTKQVTDAWSRSMKSLGLAAPKNDQMLITDYYKVEGAEKQEKSLTTSGTSKQLSGEDGKKQKLVTDFFKSTDEEEAPPKLLAINVVDGKTVLEPMKTDTEPTTTTSTSKSSLDPLARLKGFFSKSSKKKEKQDDAKEDAEEEKEEEKDAIEADREEAEKQQMDLTFFGFTLCACVPGPVTSLDEEVESTKKEEPIVG